MHPLVALAALPGVPEAVEEAREACTRLRWHRALRRQWAVVRAEADVRAAWAGLAADGVRVPLDLVRDVARGAAEPPSGPAGGAVLGALRVQAEVSRMMAAPGAAGPAAPPVPLAQLLARLHAVLGTDAPGRPRETVAPQDLTGLGAAPEGTELAHRLRGVAELVAQPLPPGAPALVRAAVVHGELLVLRPFDAGNGAVARAVLRHLLTRDGVEPVGVVVPETAWTAQPMLHLSRAAGFATGQPGAVGAWLVHCAEAVVAGARDASEVADAVLAGRGLVGGTG